MEKKKTKVKERKNERTGDGDKAMVALRENGVREEKMSGVRL